MCHIIIGITYEVAFKKSKLTIPALEDRLFVNATGERYGPSHAATGLVHIHGPVKCFYIDLHISLEHRTFLRFAIQGQEFQFIGLPFGLSLAPWVF